MIKVCYVVGSPTILTVGGNSFFGLDGNLVGMGRGFLMLTKWAELRNSIFL